MASAAQKTRFFVSHEDKRRSQGAEREKKKREKEADCTKGKVGCRL